MVDSITVTPAERAEVVIDFGGAALGSTIDVGDRLQSGAFNSLLRFEVTRRSSEDSQLPDRLAPTQRLEESAATATRDFLFHPDPRASFPPFKWTINGTGFDPAASGPRIPMGSVEIWRFNNRPLNLGPLAAQEHPVHVHLVNFLVPDRNGKAPAAYESGWKDTVRVGLGEVVRVIAMFTPFSGKYVMHCHNLAHEDHSMMANFEVI